jgi:small subunit ribosomal protein S18
MANSGPPQRNNKPMKKKSNPLRSGQHIDYKDTATLRKFISERGKIRARRVTGLSVQEQLSVGLDFFNAV